MGFPRVIGCLSSTVARVILDFQRWRRRLSGNDTAMVGHPWPDWLDLSGHFRFIPLFVSAKYLSDSGAALFRVA